MWYGGGYKNSWDVPPRPDRMTVMGLLRGLHYSTKYHKPEAISQERWNGMMKWIKTRLAESDGNLATVIVKEMSIMQDWE